MNTIGDFWVICFCLRFKSIRLDSTQESNVFKCEQFQCVLFGFKWRKPQLFYFVITMDQYLKVMMES